jgi:hypothetical protein
MLGCVVGALMLATWAATIDAGAASSSTDAGCRGLSPASAQDCSADELRAALDR